mmetsp:Transcript_113037/g.298594  ORF Transcript_113037/g.298594 Transcript_113037/m.298594 type:complete len:253 (-) Transcript_113037:105-863(-)
MTVTVKRVMVAGLAVMLFALAHFWRRELVQLLVALMVAAEALGYVGMLLYALFFMAATLVMVPTAPLEMAGGLLYAQREGLATAIALAAAAKITSGAVAFVLGRTLLARVVEERVLPRFPIFRATTRAIKTEPFKMICLVRFAPIPTIAKSLGLAACGAPFLDFLIASAIFGVPWSVIGVLAGSSLASFAEIFDGRGEDRIAEMIRPWKEMPIVLGALGIVLCGSLFYGYRIFKRIYTDALEGVKVDSEASR